MVNGGYLTAYHTVGVRRVLCDQFIATRNGKLPWSTKEFVRTVCEIEHHDVGSSRIFADEFHDKHPQEWTEQALITIEEATEAYRVDVIAASHC